jgi:hypothetical protein
LVEGEQGAKQQQDEQDNVESAMIDLAMLDGRI